MATTEQYTTSTATSSSSDGIGFDSLYLKSINGGILKIIEMVLLLVAFICASVDPWGYLGGGWVQFVTISAFIVTLLFFIFHLFRIIYKLPGPWGLIEFIYYGVYCICLLIAGIVAAARGAQYSHCCKAIGASAFFTFAALVAFIIDLFFLYRGWQVTRSGGGTSSSATTTTTTTHTSYETKTQY